MATSPLQLAANHANAQLSTGPQSDEGKLASSRNSLSHGLTSRDALLPSEDPAAYDFHHQIRIDHYRPQDPIEHALVVELADLEWRLRRVPTFEARLLTIEARKLSTESEAADSNLHSEVDTLAAAFTRLIEGKILPNLHNQENRLARRVEKIRKQLAARPSPPPSPENPENEPISAPRSPIRVLPKPGRNETCLCGSGLKFKRCCLNTPQPVSSV